MTSTIDRGIPASAAALLSPAVRANFNAAANDIEALQAAATNVDSQTVHKTGDETISGKKAMVGGITGLPAPSLPSDAARFQDVQTGAAGILPFATKAAMDADSTHTGFARVGADGTNNGTYYRSSTGGAWTRSTDPDVAAESTSRAAADSVLSGTTFTQGPNPVVSGTDAAYNDFTWWANDPIANDAIVSGVQIKVRAPANAGTVTLVFGSFNGTSSATLQRSIVVPLTTTGTITFSLLDLLTIDATFNPNVKAGWRGGIYGLYGGLPDYVSASGKTSYYCSGMVGTGTALGVFGAYEIEMNWTFVSGDAGQQLLASTLVALGNLSQQNNYSAITAGASPASGGNSWFSGEVVARDGTLYGLRVNSPGPASVTVFAASVVSGKIGVIRLQRDYKLRYGDNNIPDFNADVKAGDIVGIYSTSPMVTYAGTVGKSALYCAGVAAAGVTLSTSNNVELKIGWQVASGTRSAPSLARAVGDAVTPMRTALDGAGFGLLSAADPTGAADSTAAFVGALAGHPNPYVPPGIYNVTSLPKNGWGLWGPVTAQVYVNGVLFALPTSPELFNRWHAFRASFAPQLGTGSALILIGDSLTNGLRATTEGDTFGTLLCRYANAGISTGDECVLANFDTSDTSGAPSFHGVTAVNPATITTVDAGPLGVAWQLAVGQAIQVTGAYNSVDVTYNGVSGGQLTFAYNGTTYKTLSCASSGSDVYSGVSATGQTASGVYTITNTGSVPIVITSIARFGILGTNKPPRLVVCRIAHGSYTHDTFTTARLASAVRIATAITGGSNHAVIAYLGTNDEAAYGLSFTAIRTSTLRFIDDLLAQGVAVYHMQAALPWRWGSYSNGGVYEQGNAGIYDAYLTRSVTKFVKFDGFDPVAWGYSSDGGHANTAFNRIMFNAVVDARV